MLRQELSRKVSEALDRLITGGSLPAACRVDFEILDTKNPEHGDYSCNLAMVAAKPAGMNPRAIGEMLRGELASDSDFVAVDVAGPGFLNFRLKPETISKYVSTILDLGESLPSAESPKPRAQSPKPRLEVEFVSVNPNGPITVGSARGAAFGDTFCRVLEAAGNEVTREYYVNDGVNSEQMRLFAESVRAYVTNSELPSKGYKGEYVHGVAIDVMASALVGNYWADRLVKSNPTLHGADFLQLHEQALQGLAELLGLAKSPEGGRSEVLLVIARAALSFLSREQKRTGWQIAPTASMHRAVASALALSSIVSDGQTEPSLEEIEKTNESLENDSRTFLRSGAADAHGTAERSAITEIYSSALNVAKELLSDCTRTDLASKDLAWFQTISQDLMLERQRTDLHTFGVDFDLWFSEQKDLHDKGKIADTLKWLEEKGHAYWAAKAADADEDPEEEVAKEEAAFPQDATKEALWLRSSELGDDKDRVLVRADGRPTYITADIAYLKDKFDRGYDKCYLVLGPDHHGYIGRMYAACRALGKEPEKDFEIVIFQIVRFVKDGQPAPMRKRDGNIYELRDLITELGQAVAPNSPKEEQERIGTDVARFFYLMRSHDTHMDFDIDLATKQSDENPVFYVQYAHARICGVLRKAEEAGIAVLGSHGIGESSVESDPSGPNTAIPQHLNADLLLHPRELTLIKKILDLPEEVQHVASDFGVHRIATYAVELARTFHHFYDACRVIQPDQPDLTEARLALAKAAQIGLKSALDLLGVSAPERMERAEA